MKLKDILPNYPIKNMEVRMNGPDGEDMLFGYCSWTGTELISEDGDNYYLNDEISKYEFSNDGRDLTYWIVVGWNEY